MLRGACALCVRVGTTDTEAALGSSLGLGAMYSEYDALPAGA